MYKRQFAGRPEYPDNVLYKWLRNFYWRFFAQQFKRSCLPDGPKAVSYTHLVQHAFVLADVPEVAVHRFGNVDLFEGDLQLIAQDLGIAAGAVGGAEAGPVSYTHLPAGSKTGRGLDAVQG